MTRWTPAFEESLRAQHYPGQMALPGEFDQNSYLSDRPSTTVPVPDRTLIDAVTEAHRAMIAARSSFVEAVYAAVDAGYSNTVVGGAADMTEAGIRQVIKRNRRPRASERLRARQNERTLSFGMHADCGGTWIQYRDSEDSALSPGLICDRCHATQSYREVNGTPLVSGTLLAP